MRKFRLVLRFIVIIKIIFKELLLINTVQFKLFFILDNKEISDKQFVRNLPLIIFGHEGCGKTTLLSHIANTLIQVKE